MSGEWMAFRYDPEDDWHSPGHPWGVCLDLAGWSPALRTAFRTREEAEEFIRDEIMTATADLDG